jgi:hypothetical protein
MAHRLEDRLEAVTTPEDEDVVAGIIGALLDELPGPISEKKYAALIKENGYALVTELRDLTRDDLEQLGLSPGHAKAVVRKLRAQVAVVQQPGNQQQQNQTAAIPQKLVRCSEFPEVQANGLPLARPLRAWSDQYSAAMRANAVPPSRQDVVDHVMNNEGGGKPEQYVHGDEIDVLLYDLLQTAGPKGLPVELSLSLPKAYRDLKQGLNCLAWIYSSVLKSSDQSVGVLSKWFNTPPPVTKKERMTQCLVMWQNAYDTLKPTDVAARNSLGTLTAEIKEATRAIEALEAVHEEIPVDVMLAALKKVASKFSSVAAQKEAVAMFSDGGATAYNVMERKPPQYSNPVKRERKGRCKFYDAGVCKFGDNCRWNHIDGKEGENNDMVGPYRIKDEHDDLVVRESAKPSQHRKTSDSVVSLGEQAALMASLKAAADVLSRMMPGVMPSVCQVLVIVLTLAMVGQLQARSEAVYSAISPSIGETLST